MDQLEFCKQVARSQENKDPQIDVDMTGGGLKRTYPSQKYTLCHFGGVKELTPLNEEELPFNPNPWAAPKKTMRCFYEDCRLKVIAKGGSEFASNVRHKILAVYPLDDGILIKAVFNADLYAFELGGGVTHQGAGGRNLSKPSISSNSSQHRDTFVYLSLLSHPLDDATPIAFESPDTQMINTTIDIVYVSPSCPFVVIHDKASNETRFCLLKMIYDGAAEGDNSGKSGAIHSIDQDSRGIKQQLPSLIGSSKVLMQTVQTIEKSHRPQNVVVTQGISPNEILVCLYFAETKQVHVYASDLRKIDRAYSFKKTMVYQNVGQMLQLSFTKSLFEGHLKLTPSKLILSLNQRPQETDTKLSLLKHRLSATSYDLALLSADHQFVTIYYAGYTLVHQVNLTEQLNSMGHAKANVHGITWSHESASTLHLDINHGRTISIELSISQNFLIATILNVLKRMLPVDTYEAVVQGTFRAITGKPHRFECFDAFGDMLLSMVTGKEDLKMLVKDEPVDYVQALKPKKEEAKGQIQEKASAGKVLRVSSATTKIKPVSKDAAPDKRVATISVPQSSIKSSPGKSSGLAKPGSKLQVKKINKPDGSPVAKAAEFSKAILIPNAFELMLKSGFGQNDKLLQSLSSEFFSDTSEPARSPPKNTAKNNFMKPQSASPKKVQDTDKKVRLVSLVDYAEMIFQVLHLMHEELKLSKLLYATQSAPLRRLLYALALHKPSRRSYLAYYLTEDPSLTGPQQRAGEPIEHVPNIMEWLGDVLEGKETDRFPVLFDNTRVVCRLYEIFSQKQASYFLELVKKEPKRIIRSGSLFLHGQDRPKQLTSSSVSDYFMLSGGVFGSLHLFEKVLYCLKEEKFGMDQIQALPDLVSLPLLEVIRYTRMYQQEVQTVQMWPPSLYKLIRREDIVNNLKAFEGGQTMTELASEEPRLKKKGSFAFSRRDSNVFNDNQEVTKVQKIQNQYIQDLIGEEKAQDAAPASKAESKESVIAEFLKNRFGKDTRYKEAEYLLSSSVDMVLKIDSLLQGGHADQVAMNEEERQRRQKLQLDKLFARHLSKCIGRGALTLGTQETLPTETLQIPKISQQGLVVNPGDQSENLYGQTVSINLEGREQREILQWPSFHNGVATALRISQQGFKRDNRASSNQASNNLNHARDWIMFHKPLEPKNEHGGFLLGIGLLGQLDSLRPTDLYQHLKSAHDSTTIGILLGRAVSQIGKMDDADSRTMCLHIPSLLPQNLSVEISLPVQSAAVIGAGLLYQQSQNRLITEMLLSQIGRKPTSDKIIEREGYALASGIALGLVNLARNNDQTPKQRVTASSNVQDRAQNPFNQDVQFSELTDLKLDDRLIRFIEGGKKMPLPRSMLQTVNNSESSKSSAIKENDMVNVYVTSSGALFALTLIYLKTNNKTIADRLQVPDSFHAMEFVRPLALLQKILCRNLIMWDHICPTKEWLFSNIPKIIRELFESDMETIDKEFSKRFSIKEIDFATVALCYVNILAGAAFSVGFKYAGTGNLQAKELLEGQIAFFRKQLKVVPGSQPLGGPIQTNTCAQTKNQVDKSTVETCLCILALSLGMVMAGKCDVGCFRIMRVLRKRFEGEMHYGFNMAINMAIGFLFLGSGAYTFSRSNEAIAALLCATYPIFPSSPSDNRYHLQALRHFYVLAIETRLLQARDIDTGSFVNIEVLVTLEDEADQKVKQIIYLTPDIINGKILQLQVKSNSEFHDLTLQVAEANESESIMQVDQFSRELSKGQQSRFEQSALQRVIYVKRKTHGDKKETHQSTGERLVQAIRLRESFEDSIAQDMTKNATTAVTNLKRVKDPSIEVFMQKFLTSLFRVDRSVKPVTESDLTLCLSAIQAVLLSGSTQHSQVMQIHSVLQDLELELYDGAVIQSYQEQYETLLALNECVEDDKVASLPLMLKLLATKSNKDNRFLKSYLKFMQGLRDKGYFLHSNDGILRQSLLEVIMQSTKLQTTASLVRYVATLGETIEPTQAEFAREFDPCRLQAMSSFIRQVLQSATEVFDVSVIQKYMNQVKTNMKLTHETITVHELVREAVKHAAGNTTDDTIECVLLPGLISTI